MQFLHRSFRFQVLNVGCSVIGAGSNREDFSLYFCRKLHTFVESYGQIADLSLPVILMPDKGAEIYLLAIFTLKHYNI